MRRPTPVFDPKAVLEGRPPGRAQVGIIAGIVLAALGMIVVLGIDMLQSVAAGHGVVPFAIAAPLALAPVPLLVAAVLFMDRLEPEPRANLVFGFVWGAGVAALFAVGINTAGLVFITQPELGASFGQYISATAGAPVVEETLKGLFLVWLVRWRRQELDGPTDGVIYAAMVGLGFAMMENIGYYMEALINPTHGGAQLLGYTFVLRGLVSPLAHPIFTSMTGIGAAYAASHRHAGWALPLGWLAAMGLHAMWNGLGILGPAGLVIAYTILMGVLAVILIVLIADRRRIVRLLAGCLPAYQPTGLVMPGDVRMLTTLSGRRMARNWALATAGLAAAAAISDYQLAATELALLHQKAERGVISPARFTARQRELLGLMRAARDAFLRRRPQPPPAQWAGRRASAFTCTAFPATPVLLPPMPEPQRFRRPGRLPR